MFQRIYSEFNSPKLTTWNIGSDRELENCSYYKMNIYFKYI